MWVDDPKECWKRKKIPIKILNPDDEEEVYDWIEKATNDNAEEYKNLNKVASKYRLNLSTFNIPYLALDSDTNPAVAIEVFINLNTSYVKLTAFDIIVAQVEELTDISLHNKVATLKTEVPEISDYINSENFVLSVSSLLQNRLPNQRGYFNLDLKQMIDEWDKIIKGSKELIKLLEEQNIFDSERLPTETILAPLAALLAEAPDAPDAKGSLLLFLRSYMWRAFFTDRYDRSIPTRILQDFRGTKNYFAGNAKLEEIPIFNEKFFPLPSEEMLTNTGWPKKKDRLARAILLLSFKKGAIDFADNSHISKRNIKLREYHHIFPVNLLNKQGKKKNDIYQSLNCALITWKTNRVISDKNPLEYLLERANASTLGENEIKHRLGSHLIDYDIIKEANYQKFIETRANTIKNVMEKLSRGVEWE